MFGVMFAAGFRIDDVLDMTLPQAREVVQSITIARARFVDALLSPLIDGLGEISGSGAKWSKAKRRKRGAQTQAQKEAELLMGLNAAGIDIDEG